MTALGFPAFPPVGRGVFARSWWGREWIKAMEDSALDEAQLRHGRKYARGGYVGAITVSAGRLSATVRDYEDDTSYQTIMRLEPLSDAEWRRFLDQVATQSGHIAALLDGDMPADLVDAAADAGVRLLPDIGDLDPECTCPGWELPCRHAAALAYQVSWLLDSDPFVLLLLRGKATADLLSDLQSRSATEPATTAFARQPAELPDPPTIPTEAPPPPDIPAADGIDPAGLALLVIDAAQRARRMMTTDLPDLPRTADLVRYAATYPSVHLDVDPRAIEAWRNGGWDGLHVLETTWRPPTALTARAADAANTVAEGPIEVHHNHWTMGNTQVRLGRDGRWYPYRDQNGQWWPAGPPQPDIASALIAVLA
ncbi:SWF/SNF family helicase [Alloactinosynnema sp. L-07]|uniref:SWIM zinc finger family protein n=1 Tax=Alloactinosynnema sp. L-07 TaxID=1653480 RepID=UPI00065F0740|nr:SWIM zinc finger family protein [Alloactinosynnema sp. L-07]CRK57397.1 SWF/SNF family helicase [Alloactinosynnema sp. L-07]